MYELPQIDIQGTPADMGRQYGEAVAEYVHSLLENRLREAEGYFSERGVSNGVDQLQATGSAMLEALAAWDKWWSLNTILFFATPISRCIRFLIQSLSNNQVLMLCSNSR